MYELQIFFQRRRKMLTRLLALLTLGTGGMLAVLPRADAHGVMTANTDPTAILFAHEPMSGERFGTFYGLPHP